MMRQHSVQSSHAEPRTRDGDDAERSATPAPAQLASMVPIAGLAVGRPAVGLGQPTLRRTLVDNAGNVPVNITTEAQLQNYPWWNSLSELQQAHLLAQADTEVGPYNLQQALAAVPRRAVTGGMDLINAQSWALVAQLVDEYTDVVCADPAMNVGLTTLLKAKHGLDVGTVAQLIQHAAPAARNADIFIIHPGPWIFDANTLHHDLRAVMTRGCVAYVLTDHEGRGGNQANTLVQGLTQLGGFTVTVQDLIPDPEGMVDLATGPRNGTLRIEPYHPDGFKLIRIVA